MDISTSNKVSGNLKLRDRFFYSKALLENIYIMYPQKILYDSKGVLKVTF